jgi:hypothetical protein
MANGERLEAAVGHVMEALGRCLVVYQRIEVCLKYLLPHVIDPNHTPGETLAEWRSLLNSKRPLGPLVERLRESVQTSDPIGFEHYVGEVVAHRNELIHHFYQLPFGRMSSVEECEAALTHVLRRTEFALPLYHGLHRMLGQFRDALTELKLENDLGNAP